MLELKDKLRRLAETTDVAELNSIDQDLDLAAAALLQLGYSNESAISTGSVESSADTAKRTPL